MDAEFWHRRWADGRIGFHAASVNPLLERFLPSLGLTAGARVFVPLCGKTLDIGWLLRTGHPVVGVELSEIAVGQLFDGLGIAPAVDETGGMKRYHGPGVDVYVGDVFLLTRAVVGAVDAVYDRAALVALPRETRARYARQLIELTDAAPQLLITFEYDQSIMEGPPFSVDDDEVRHHYERDYRLSLVDVNAVPGGLKGAASASERVWLLHRR